MGATLKMKTAQEKNRKLTNEDEGNGAKGHVKFR